MNLYLNIYSTGTKTILFREWIINETCDKFAWIQFERIR
jgi:hypothetical protein